MLIQPDGKILLERNLLGAAVGVLSHIQGIATSLAWQRPRMCGKLTNPLVPAETNAEESAQPAVETRLSLPCKPRGRYRGWIVNLRGSLNYYQEDDVMMNLAKPTPGEKFLQFLDSYGWPQSLRERVGAIVLGSAMFENRLEQAIWRMSGESVAGARPSTDGMQAQARIDTFRALANSVSSSEWTRFVEVFCEAASNVATIRNTICHGFVLPNGHGIINNPRWHGEQRRRQAHDLHANDDTLGFVSDALLELNAAVYEIAVGSANPWENESLLRRRQALQSAASLTGEVRHLTELMNHEKY